MAGDVSVLLRAQIANVPELLRGLIGLLLSSAIWSYGVLTDTEFRIKAAAAASNGLLEPLSCR